MGRRRSDIKEKRGLLFASAIFAIVCSLMYISAYALDYPHTSVNNISCDSCHYVYGGEPSLLPPWTSHVPQHIDDTEFNTLCWSCHNDIDAPYMRTHSSLQIDNGYGDWTIECRTCHNPHEQEQLKTYTSESFLYSGTSTNITTTTLMETGAGWTEDEYEGRVLVPNVDRATRYKYGYKITGNTSDTITVEGPIDLNRVSVGDTFAVIYGKLIKSTITLDDIIDPDESKTGDRTVRFFYSSGTNSYADGDGTYDGVCEVCHTLTTHFQNDGGGSNQLHTNVGTPAGTDCTECHGHINGFAHGGGGGTGCDECHGHDPGYGGATGGKGTYVAHSTHTENDSDDLRGPNVGCDTCHDTGSFPDFADGVSYVDYKSGAEMTAVCNTCHSPGGTYDGVNDALTGAKNNWSVSTSSESSVYESDGSLKAGKEKWCAGCHDEEPSQIQSVDAPNVIGDEDGSYTYGTGWGFYKTGHGLASGDAYPYKGGLIEPSLVGGASRPVECGDCHDLTTAHIDGDARTYDDGGSSTLDPGYYRQGYRLKLVNGNEPMHIPWEAFGGSTPNNSDRYRLCAECHLTGAVFTDTGDTTNTNLVTVGINRHADHLNQENLYWSSDWDPGYSGATSRMTCVSCHNVHGSTRLAMIRDGALTNRGPGVMIWYNNDDFVVYEDYNTDPPNPEDVPLSASDGTIWRGQTAGNLCEHCHYNDNTTKEYRAPFQDVSEAPALDWTGEAGYASDGVSPDAGASGATFTFRVKYTDINNDAPHSMYLLIDTDNDGNVDDTYAMTGTDTGDVIYSNGRIYTKDLVLADSIQYKFEASDGMDPATGSPTDWHTLGLVGEVNHAPELAWVSDTCRYQGVSPATAVSGTGFEFYVEYTDADDQFGSLQVWVDLNDDGDYDDSNEKQDMTVDSGDGDYSNGENFTRTITLSYAGDGMLNYRFVASDGIEAATGDPAGVQSVAVIDSVPVTVCQSGHPDYPCNYDTIQAGVEAALDSNYVTLVKEGTYPENLYLHSYGPDYSNSKVYAECGPDVTVIDRTGNVVSLDSITGIVIDGFQITGGTIGINSYRVSATINNCKIHDNNNSTGIGAGLYTGDPLDVLTVVNSEIYSNTSLLSPAAYLNGGNHSFANSRIYDNTAIYNASYGWSGFAGAVYTQDGSVTFTDVTMSGNTAENGNGGGVYSYSSNLTFIRSTMSGNTAENGRGGAMALESGSEQAYLENCIVADNQALEGGVSYVYGATFTAVNSTFVGNRATAGDGGVLWQQNATSIFRNSILWNNTASDEGHIAWFDLNGGSMTITDTVIASGSDGIPNNWPYFASLNNDVIPSVSGYVSENDPFFVDAENGDYHLKNYSSAVDHGTAEDPPLSVDIDGDTRPFDCIGLGDGVDDYDIGADEVTDPAPIDSLSTTNPAAIESGAVDADGSIVMSRFQADCNDTGDSQCILTSVSIEDIATGLSGDWDNLEIYIDTDTDFTGATLIGREASWDGSAVPVLLDQGTQADRTVTNGTPKYVFIVYDITEAAEGKTLKSRVTQVDVKFPDIGATGLSYESNIITVNGDALSTSNNTAIQATDPGAGEANIVMQRFEADCGATGNNTCILSDITIDDLGTATFGDWDSLKIYIDTDNDFSGATLIGQSFFDGTSTAVTLDQGAEADRTVTNGTSKYIFIVYDINYGAGGKTIRSRVTGVGVESPDDGDSGFGYDSNLLTVQEAAGGDNLSTSNPAAVHNVYADQGEDGAVMERFQVDCDTADDGNCILSSITVDDLGTASTGGWDNLKIYMDTDTGFAGATLIGRTSSWDGTSTIVSLSLGTVGDRTVTNGTPKYVFVVYDLSASVVVDATLQSRVTAVGVSFPDSGVSGITYDSDVVTVKDAKYVGSGELYETIQAAVDAASDGDIIIVSEGTYTENVDHSPPAVTKVLHIYSAYGPENTIIDGNYSGSSVVTLGYRSGTSTLSGFTITNGSVFGTGGAGIYVNNAQPTIDDCIITGNDSGGYPGGGIHISHPDSDVTITNTIISNNIGGDGGGLYLSSGTKATISNVVFDHNTGDWGGAIYFNATDGTTSITNSTFTGNSSTGDGGAFFIQGVNGIKFSKCTITGNHAGEWQYGGVLISDSNTTFENCIIAGNYALVGGVFSLNGGAITLMNSTVADNYATYSWAGGGGGIAYVCNNGTVNMTNSIAWGNSAASGDGHAVYNCGSGNVGTIAYSDFEGWPSSGLPGAPYLYNGSVTDGGGNIAPATDPDFVDDDDPAPYDYHLTSSSTNVIDAGTSSGAPSDDIDGDSRPYNSVYDMGADEYAP